MDRNYQRILPLRNNVAVKRPTPVGSSGIGSVASLEEMFDPDRVKETHLTGGWSPPGSESRAIAGHEFGLNLTAREREQLIAFLRTHSRSACRSAVRLNLRMREHPVQLV